MNAVNRLVAEHFGPKGTPKRKFPTQDAAVAYRSRRRIKGKTAYLCTVCGCWHLGGKR